MDDHLTRYAYLTNIADTARKVALSALTNPLHVGLTVSGALDIANAAEQERQTLTLPEAAMDIELYWQAQLKAAHQA